MLFNLSVIYLWCSTPLINTLLWPEFILQLVHEFTYHINTCEFLGMVRCVLLLSSYVIVSFSSYCVILPYKYRSFNLLILLREGEKESPHYLMVWCMLSLDVYCRMKGVVSKILNIFTQIMLTKQLTSLIIIFRHESRWLHNLFLCSYSRDMAFPNCQIKSYFEFWIYCIITI